MGAGAAKGTNGVADGSSAGSSPFFASVCVFKYFAVFLVLAVLLLLRRMSVSASMIYHYRFDCGNDYRD